MGISLIKKVIIAMNKPGGYRSIDRKLEARQALELEHKMIYPWGQGGGVWCELSMYSTHAPRKGRGVAKQNSSSSSSSRVTSRVSITGMSSQVPCPFFLGLAIDSYIQAGLSNTTYGQCGRG